MAVAMKQERLREAQERVARTALHFLRSRAKMDDLIARSASQGRIPFAAINDYVENDLFALKEECHSLFRNQENPKAVDLSSAGLFDILIGSLFHQMMKVKENTYQLECYAPKYAALRRAVHGHQAPEHGEAFLREGERLLQRARRALRQDLAHAVELFAEATVVLRHVINENRDNPLVVRMLLDNEKAVREVYGLRSIDKLLGEMYDGRPAAGYLIAAGDLFEGGWFDKARAYCQRARALDPKNRLATQLLNKINAAAGVSLQ